MTPDERRVMTPDKRLVAILEELAKNPEASASAIARKVGGRREDVLRAIQLLRAGGWGGTPADTQQRPGTGSRRAVAATCPACGADLTIRVTAE